MYNFQRPFLVKHGAELLLILILVGAIGYTLLDAWIEEGDQPATAIVAPPKAE